MGLLRRLFGSAASEDEATSDTEPPEDGRSAVTAWVRLFDPAFENEREQQRVLELENRIIAAVESAGAGIYDTNELARGAFGMRLVGSDPNRLVSLLRPLLADAPAGSYLTVRRGGAGTSEERLEIVEDDSVG